MKSIRAILTLSIFLCLAILKPTTAQETLNQNLQIIKEKVTEIQIDKSTFKQSFDVLDEVSGKVLFTSVEVDEKGKSAKESFEVFLSTIDKNTLIRKTSGKKLMVSISVNNNQNFIKHFKEDKIAGYVNNIEILVTDADAATQLISLIKSTIPLVKSKENEWKNAKDPLNWLKGNIGKVSSGDITYSQSFGFDDKKEYLVNFSISKLDDKGVSTDETFDFNILDINKNEIQLEIKGTNLSVSLLTKGKDKFIRHFKNKEIQNFCADFEIMTNDIEQAQGIISALTSAISMAKSSLPVFKSLDESLDFIRVSASDVTIDNKTLTQKFVFLKGNGTKVDFLMTESGSQGKSIESHYEFYLDDIEPNSIILKISGKKALLLWNVKNKQKFIKFSKDNALQGFQNDFELTNIDIEVARGLIEAFKYASKMSEQKPVTWANMNDALKFISESLSSQSTGNDNNKQSMVTIGTQPFQCRYIKAKTDAKNVTIEEKSEFYPYMLDPNSVSVGASGKWLTVNALTRNKKSFIKTYKNDLQQNYQTELEFMSVDSKQAKDLAEALKYIANNGKSKDKDWSDKQKAMNYVIEKVGDLKGADKDLKQKISLTDADPCKIVFTVNTTDDKSKTTEEIFEFNLSDMNKLIADYKISGKNVVVILVCKNREKLIKVYKNGEQQSFNSDVELAVDDVDTALNLVDALKATIGACEK
jgi:hypothetical protein